MPRDLTYEAGIIPLTESPNSNLSPSREVELSVAARHKPSPEHPDGPLHPYTRPLTISDLESCVALENAAFDEHERCSREKPETTFVKRVFSTLQAVQRANLTLLQFIYRLTKCGEMSLGIFCSIDPSSTVPAETLKTGHPVETSRASGAIAVLVAQAIGTCSNDESVTDKAMDFPRDWQSDTHAEPGLGHQDGGRTVCIHSLAVLPRYQGRGLGQIMLSAYTQQIMGAGTADRIVLLAHDHMVPFYRRHGFVDRGPSAAEFGGGGWHDLVHDLKPVKARIAYG